ncbi:SGNH/GDSL hydrolase family protein [Tundrisphaera sp. TA3]|uniref:SGNH/GDSL hydrolase family protein n=1 Tax=Tundrisphaera sp. TA3 TaxID=3435775 RepID=UPI003EC0A2A0
MRDGDRIAWVGSSSTRIGIWTRTAEFLLRTRQPRLSLEFQRCTTGGGTFATGLEHLDGWIGEFRPSLVVFNYGGNDAAAGRKGIPKFLDNMNRCVDKARAAGARVILVTPQAADVRKSGVVSAAQRTLYAEAMLKAGRGRALPVIDIHWSSYVLQTYGQRMNPTFSILRDDIHLTDPAYVAWGFFFFDRLGLPPARSEARLTAEGRLTAEVSCQVRDVEASEDGLAFTRCDAILPILPPGPLPPRGCVPLESRSRYLLGIDGLPDGDYLIRCEGDPIGVAPAWALAAGVNLNSLLLDSGHEAPWSGLAAEIWEGRGIDRVGRTAWRFEIRKL